MKILEGNESTFKKEFDKIYDENKFLRSYKQQTNK